MKVLNSTIPSSRNNCFLIGKPETDSSCQLAVQDTDTITGKKKKNAMFISDRGTSIKG